VPKNSTVQQFSIITFYAQNCTKTSIKRSNSYSDWQNLFELTIKDGIFFVNFVPQRTLTILFIFSNSSDSRNIRFISSSWVRMCGHSGTFDPYWDDFGWFISKTQVIGRHRVHFFINYPFYKNRYFFNFYC